MKHVLLVILSALLGNACSIENAPLVASDISIARPAPGMQMTAAYFTLTNNTSQRITITAVTSPQFGVVQMHESVIEDGMARMYELGDVTILPGKSVVFEPGAKHLMLMQAQSDIDNVTLEFIAGKAVMLSVNVALGD